MVKCPICARESDAANRFCGHCGKSLQVEPAVPIDGVQYCYKHKKEATHLSCGRCERPICTKCAVIGPAGVRCRECSRNKVAVRPTAVAHEMSYGLRSLFRGGPYSIYIMILVAGMILSYTRGCFASQQRPAVPVDIESEAPAPQH